MVEVCVVVQDRERGGLGDYGDEETGDLASLESIGSTLTLDLLCAAEVMRFDIDAPDAPSATTRRSHSSALRAEEPISSDMGPAAVAFLALGATVLNPKNLVLLVAAGQTIAAADVSGGAAVAVGAVFVAVATLPYSLTAAYAVFGGDGAVVRLDALRTWLVQRNRLIMGVVAGLLGLLLVAKAAAALT